jgi:ABC-type multidrug transport system fused ATPase/permease subunit
LKIENVIMCCSLLYDQENGHLLRVLWKLVAPTFVPAAFMELVYVVARITLPLTMRELLIVLEENPNESVIREGFPYAVIIFVAAVLGAFAHHRETHLATKSGIIMRAALVSTIYEHSLKLTAKGKARLASGEITNLIATDTQKLFEVTVEGNNVWSCPVFVVIVTGLLWHVMGPELIVGVLVLIAFVPIVQSIVSRMLKIRRQRAILTDERVNIITAMLQGIRVTKLNHYESKVLDRIGAVRNEEMKLLRSELFMWGWTLVSAVCSPLLATAVAFTCFVLVNENNLITPSSAFTVLLLFSILRFPINMTARLVAKLAQALDSANRISDFLARETLATHGVLLEEKQELRTEDTMVYVDNATFAAKEEHNLSVSKTNSKSGEGYSFAVRDVGFTVGRTEKLAIVGRVGSGKSMLLHGLLGELDLAPGGSVAMNGTVGFAAQTPFILNTTLRDNILFGSTFDKQRYERVLAACCLTTDIQQFRGGDMCQIGERGVTLSGGQKARVGVARVLYANPSIVLLDDIFSALDAETASAVFEGLFGPDGVLQSQSTILVTHATKFLMRMDRIVFLSEGKVTFSGTWAELQQLEGKDAITALDASYSPSLDEKYNLTKSRKKEVEPFQDNGDKEEGLMTAEEKEHGMSQLRIWYLWFEHAGGWSFFLIQILFLSFDRTMYVASEWYVFYLISRLSTYASCLDSELMRFLSIRWISVWADASDESVEVFGRNFPPQTDGRSAQAQCIAVYYIILAFSIIGTTLRSHWGGTTLSS